MFHKPINHLLRNQEWAKDKLRPYAGKTVCLNMSPLQFVFRITETGETTPSDSSPDATINIDSGFLPQLISRTATPSREIKITGDADLAATVAFVFRNLKWDVEEDLSYVFGDVVAHRMALLGSRFLNWTHTIHQSLSHSLAEYLTEEKSVLIKDSQANEFYKEVDALREAADRLEKKLNQLAKKLNH